MKARERLIDRRHREGKIEYSEYPWGFIDES